MCILLTSFILIQSTVPAAALDNVKIAQKNLNTAGGAEHLVSMINQTKITLGHTAVVIPIATSLNVSVPFTSTHIVPAVVPTVWSTSGAVYAGQLVTVRVSGAFGLQLGAGLDAAKVVSVDVACSSPPGGGTTETTDLGPGT